MSSARAVAVHGSVVVTGPTITALAVACLDHYVQVFTHQPLDPWTLGLVTIVSGSLLSALVFWLHQRGIYLPDPNQPITAAQPVDPSQPVTLTQHYTLTAPPTVTMSAPTGGTPSGN